MISDRADAAGIARARELGLATSLVERAAFAAASDFEAALLGALAKHAHELVALAGFMRILDTRFVEAWTDRMINIHPSLLPAFPGLHPQRQALAAGVKFSGCTVHFVRAAVDTGVAAGDSDW